MMRVLDTRCCTPSLWDNLNVSYESSALYLLFIDGAAVLTNDRNVAVRDMVASTQTYNFKLL